MCIHKYMYIQYEQISLFKSMEIPSSRPRHSCSSWHVARTTRAALRYCTKLIALGMVQGAWRVAVPWPARLDMFF